MKTIISVIFLVVIFGCKDSVHNFYNESNYILIKADSFDGKLDREFYAYKYDSARKMQINYWDNGKLMGKGFYYHDHLEGKLEIYDISGKLMAIDSFSNGKKINSKIFYIPDTSVKLFRNGKMEPFTSIDSLMK